MVSERLWRHALILSALVHAVALGTTGSLARQSQDPRGVERASMPNPDLGGLRGETFEIDGLVGSAASAPGPAPAGWDLGRIRQLAATMTNALSAHAAAPPVSRPPQARPHVDRSHREKAPGVPAAAPASAPAVSVPAAASAVPPEQPAAVSAPGPSGREPPSRANEDGIAPRAKPGASAPSGGRRYGAAMARDGSLLLAPALTRAIPAAVSADPIWSQLPPGVVGAIEVSISIDGEGAVDEVSIPTEAPEPLQRLAVRTVSLLRAGRFALTRARGAGRESLRVEVTLSDPSNPEPAPAEGAARRELQLGFEAPSAGRPGRGWFTLASGRHFEATVTVLSSLAAVPPPAP